MRDQTALTYFIQFLEPLGALCYVHFWLSADNFRTAIKESEAKESVSPVELDGDCCPDVKQTLSKLLLQHDGGSSDSEKTENGSDQLASGDGANSEKVKHPEFFHPLPLRPNFSSFIFHAIY